MSAREKKVLNLNLPKQNFVLEAFSFNWAIPELKPKPE